MLELPHAIVGATLATKINNPFIALPAAFLSNFILDLLPHWNPHLYTDLKNKGKISKKNLIIVLADSFLGLILGVFLAVRFYPNLDKIFLILAGCFFAVIADLVEAPYFFLNSKNKYILKLISFQRSLQWNAPPLPGLLSQLILVSLCFFILFS
jgi:hypothetical protein